jgi:beta-glucosidase
LARDWVVEGTDYAVEVGASSRDIRALEIVSIPGDDFLPELTLLSTYGEWMAQSRGGAALATVLERFDLKGRGITDVDSVAFKMISGFRLQQFIDMFALSLSPEDLEGLLQSARSR